MNGFEAIAKVCKDIDDFDCNVKEYNEEEYKTCVAALQQTISTFASSKEDLHNFVSLLSIHYPNASNVINKHCDIKEL